MSSFQIFLLNEVRHTKVVYLISLLELVNTSFEAVKNKKTDILNFLSQYAPSWNAVRGQEKLKIHVFTLTHSPKNCKVFLERFYILPERTQDSPPIIFKFSLSGFHTFLEKAPHFHDEATDAIRISKLNKNWIWNPLSIHDFLWLHVWY